MTCCCTAPCLPYGSWEWHYIVLLPPRMVHMAWHTIHCFWLTLVDKFEAMGPNLIQKWLLKTMWTRVFHMGPKNDNTLCYCHIMVHMAHHHTLVFGWHLLTNLKQWDWIWSKSWLVKAMWTHEMLLHCSMSPIWVLRMIIHCATATSWSIWLGTPSHTAFWLTLVDKFEAMGPNLIQKLASKGNVDPCLPYGS
jgi:hypothetical protein